MTGGLIKKETGHRDTGECRVKMKAEIRMMLQKPRIASTPPEAWRKACDKFSLTTFRKNQPHGHHDLGLLASRTVRINFCGLSHPVCSASLWQP